MAQTPLQTLLFAAHSYSALRAGRAELGSGGGLPGQRPPVRELQAVLLGATACPSMPPTGTASATENYWLYLTNPLSVCSKAS
uniref:Secreted protein n=1 Tax=Macrostomum lignano TaxID=282301 RepID=A0A1I8FMT1_9PLAT